MGIWPGALGRSQRLQLGSNKTRECRRAFDELCRMQNFECSQEFHEGAEGKRLQTQPSQASAEANRDMKATLDEDSMNAQALDEVLGHSPRSCRLVNMAGEGLLLRRAFLRGCRSHPLLPSLLLCPPTSIRTKNGSTPARGDVSSKTACRATK